MAFALYLGQEVGELLTGPARAREAERLYRENLHRPEKDYAPQNRTAPEQRENHETKMVHKPYSIMLYHACRLKRAQNRWTGRWSQALRSSRSSNFCRGDDDLYNQDYRSIPIQAVVHLPSWMGSRKSVEVVRVWRRVGIVELSSQTEGSKVSGLLLLMMTDSFG